MKPYSELNKMPASDFLNPDLFKTAFDGPRNADYRAKQYEKGARIARESAETGVSANGCWYANGKDGAVTTSYEGIGYHAGTADLWRGLLGCGRVAVWRNGEKHVIKG